MILKEFRILFLAGTLLASSIAPLFLWSQWTGNSSATVATLDKNGFVNDDPKVLNKGVSDVDSPKKSNPGDVPAKDGGTTDKKPEDGVQADGSSSGEKDSKNNPKGGKEQDKSKTDVVEGKKSENTPTSRDPVKPDITVVTVDISKGNNDVNGVLGTGSGKVNPAAPNNPVAGSQPNEKPDVNVPTSTKSPNQGVEVSGEENPTEVGQQDKNKTLDSEEGMQSDVPSTEAQDKSHNNGVDGNKQADKPDLKPSNSPSDSVPKDPSHTEPKDKEQEQNTQGNNGVNGKTEKNESTDPTTSGNKGIDTAGTVDKSKDGSSTGTEGATTDKGVNAQGDKKEQTVENDSKNTSKTEGSPSLNPQNPTQDETGKSSDKSKTNASGGREDDDSWMPNHSHSDSLPDENIPNTKDPSKPDVESKDSDKENKSTHVPTTPKQEFMEQDYKFKIKDKNKQGVCVIPKDIYEKGYVVYRPLGIMNFSVPVSKEQLSSIKIEDIKISLFDSPAWNKNNQKKDKYVPITKEQVKELFEGQDENNLKRLLLSLSCKRYWQVLWENHYYSMGNWFVPKSGEVLKTGIDIKYFKTFAGLKYYILDKLQKCKDFEDCDAKFDELEKNMLDQDKVSFYDTVINYF